MSALLLQACGDDDPNPTDTTDAGGVVMDATVGTDARTDSGADTGRRDVGDTGSRDVIDMGGTTTSITEGRSCPEGSTCATGLTCVGFGEDSEGNDIRVCLRVCQNSTECTGSTLTPAAETCAQEGRLVNNMGQRFGWCVQELVGEGQTFADPPLLATASDRLRDCSEGTAQLSITETRARCLKTCDVTADCATSVLTPPATICGGGVCVQSTVGEGEVATVSATMVQGCAEGLTRFGGDEPGLTECARTCATAADCRTAGIGVCNINRGTFTSTTNPIAGVCTRREGTVGTPCSRRHIIEGCTLDRERQGTVFCSDVWGLLGDEEMFEGVCTGFCGDLDANATTAPETCRLSPTRPGDPAPTCVTRTNEGNPLFGADFPNAGVCSDGCSDSPNSCGGALPTQCFTVPNTALIRYSQCVTPAEPTLPVWYPALGAPTAVNNCFDRYHRCPDDSYCVGVNAAQELSACIYGCNANAPAAQSGCAGKTINGMSNLACTRLVDGQADGFCEPM